MISSVILGLLVIVTIFLIFDPLQGFSQSTADKATAPIEPTHKFPEDLPERLSGRFSEDYESYKRREQEVLALREKQAMNVRGFDYTNSDIFDDVTRDIRGY